MQPSLFAENWRTVIVNEAHAMTPMAVQAWLTLLEKLPARWLVIFTSTEPTAKLFGLFNGAFFSRTKVVTLTKVNLVDAFASRLRTIARSIGSDGKPPTYYRRAISMHGCNLRAAIQGLEAGTLPDAGRLTANQQRAVRDLVKRSRRGRCLRGKAG